MRAPLTILLLFLLLALESPLLYQLELAFYAPDFALIVVLHIGMRYGAVPGVLSALVVGMFKDAYALGSPIGMYMQISVVLFLATKAISSQLDLRSVPLSMVAAFVASLLSSLLFLVLTLIFDRSFEDYQLVFKMMGPQALVTAPFAPILFLLLDRLDKVTTRRRSGSIFFR